MRKLISKSSNSQNLYNQKLMQAWLSCETLHIIKARRFTLNTNISQLINWESKSRATHQSNWERTITHVKAAAYNNQEKEEIKAAKQQDVWYNTNQWLEIDSMKMVLLFSLQEISEQKNLFRAYDWGRKRGRVLTIASTVNGDLLTGHGFGTRSRPQKLLLHSHLPLSFSLLKIGLLLLLLLLRLAVLQRKSSWSFLLYSPLANSTLFLFYFIFLVIKSTFFLPINYLYWKKHIYFYYFICFLALFL